jgi:hypothetical protein
MLKNSFIGLAFLCLSTTIVFCNNADSSSIPSSTEKISENLGTQWTPVALNDEDETVSAFVIAKKGRSFPAPPQVYYYLTIKDKVGGRLL